jgi:hypothetical protein
LRAARPARTIEHVFACDPAELVRNGIATLAREDRRSWPAAAHTERLLELRELQERLDAEMARCVAGWDAAAAWAEGTALGPKSWLASRARMTRPEADRLLKSARLVRDHEGTAVALAAGEVTARQVESLAVAARQRGDAYAQHETEPPRSRAQRFADVLVLMAERSQGGTLPDSRPIAGADIVVDHKILARHPLVELDGLRCDIEGFGPIPRVTAERLGSARPARAASCDGAGRVSAQTSTAARRSS